MYYNCNIIVVFVTMQMRQIRNRIAERSETRFEHIDKDCTRPSPDAVLAGRKPQGRYKTIINLFSHSNKLHSVTEM